MTLDWACLETAEHETEKGMIARHTTAQPQLSRTAAARQSRSQTANAACAWDSRPASPLESQPAAVTSSPACTRPTTHLRYGAVALAFQRAHGMQGHVFGRAVGQPAHRGRDVRAVPVAVLPFAARLQRGEHLIRPAPRPAVGKPELLVGHTYALHSPQLYSSAIDLCATRVVWAHVCNCMNRPFWIVTVVKYAATAPEPETHMCAG